MSLGVKGGYQLARNLAVNTIRKHGTVPSSNGYKAIMKKQTYYLTDNGRMVWEKSFGDRVLYRLTIGLTGATTGYAMYLVYTWVYPQQ